MKKSLFLGRVDQKEPCYHIPHDMEMLSLFFEGFTDIQNICHESTLYFLLVLKFEVKNYSNVTITFPMM